MATIKDRIIFELRAENKELKRGFARAQGDIRRFQKQTVASLNKIKKVAGGAFLAFGGMSALRGAMTSIKDSVETIDKIGKASRSLGISSTALQEFQHAAMLASVDQENLNKALSIGVKNAGELRHRVGGQLSLAIKNYNSALLESIRSADSSEEAINLMFNALANETDALTRASLARQFFGRAGAAMIPMIDQGADALEDMRKEAHKLGVVYDEKTVKGAEDLSDAMARQAKIIDKELKEAWISLGPAVVTGLEFVGAGIKNTKSYFGWLGEIGGGISKGFTDAGIQAKLLMEKIFGIKVATRDLVILQGLYEEALKKAAPGSILASNLKTQLDALNKRIKERGAETEGLAGVGPLMDDGGQLILQKGLKIPPKPLTEEEKEEKKNAQTEKDFLNWGEASGDLLQSGKMNKALQDWGNLVLPTATTLGEELADVLTSKPMAKAEKEMSSVLSDSAKNFGFALKEGAKHSKTLRKMQNKLSLAMAISATAAGVARAFELPFPLNWVQAASVAAAGLVQIRTIRAQRSQAHAGMDYVPRDETFLLRKGERVVQPEANKQLTDFLARQQEPAPVNYTFNINAMDSEGVRTFLLRNSDLVAEAVQSSKNEGAGS